MSSSASKSAHKISRNDPCSCGSGKKYKHCCLQAVELQSQPPAPITSPAQEAIEAAMAHHRAGRLAQAEEIYRQVLRIQPAHSDALHLLGLVAHQRGNHDVALEMIGKAIALEPTAAMYDNLGLVQQARDNLEEAVASFRQAVALDPSHVNAHNNLGVALKDQGKMAEAMACFLHALSLKPDYADAYCNLGLAAYEQGHLSEAVECYQQALSLAPDNAIVLNNLANALRDQCKYDAAIQCYQQSLALNPGNSLGYNSLGNLLRDLGHPDLAVEQYRKALAINPDLEYVHSNLLYTLLNIPDYNPDDIFAEHLQFARQFEASHRPFWPKHDNSRDKDRRLKIGYVSGDFYNHSIAFFILPVLAGHDKSQVEVFCYYNHDKQDEITNRLMVLSDHWIPCKSLSHEELVARIRNDRIDILVDLSGHTGRHRLLTFACKPAPLQITWMGYPNTTGLAAMDYRLTDAAVDPVGMTERFNSETLLRLPAACQFNPVAQRPPVNALPALSRNVFTFACLNSLAKITEQAIVRWAQILHAVPQARLMLGNVNTELSRNKLAQAFAGHDIAEERLVMYPNMVMGDFLALHHQIDLALDPFPFNGGTTTFHAISMGVPTVTLAGNSPVTRSGASIMANVGLPEFVTFTEEEYVQRAIEFASDLPRLERIRQSLRNGNSALYEPGKNHFAGYVEQAFRQIWTAWCGSHAGSAA